MSDARSGPSVAPRAALDALLASAAGDPIRRAMWLEAVDLRLRPHLPPSLATHARLANVDGAKLVFLVDSPVWRARLRLATPELLTAARSIGLESTQVIVRIATTALPSTPAPSVILRAPAPMSAAAREAMQAALSSPEPSGGKHRK